MQYWVLSTDSSTTIHTWAHLALATHMKTGWTNDPHVALKTLKLRAHMCPKRLCKDTPTQLKSLQLPSSEVELKKPPGWEVKCLETRNNKQTETCPAAYDTAWITKTWMTSSSLWPVLWYLVIFFWFHDLLEARKSNSIFFFRLNYHFIIAQSSGTDELN